MSKETVYLNGMGISTGKTMIFVETPGLLRAADRHGDLEMEVLQKAVEQIEQEKGQE